VPTPGPRHGWRRRRAEEQARADLAAAGRDAHAERADAAARVRKAADTEAAETLAEAEREAQRTRDLAAARMPEYVDRVVAALRAAVLGAGS
jgi:vacuolar-type H+-ATPase subunit H